MDDLTHLVGAYFYADRDRHARLSWPEAVDDFARRSPERVRGAADALRALLAEPVSDSELADRLRALGCDYLPPEGDRPWLSDVLQRLERDVNP